MGHLQQRPSAPIRIGRCNAIGTRRKYFNGTTLGQRVSDRVRAEKLSGESALLLAAFLAL
jgi:hypothetical protein